MAVDGQQFFDADPARARLLRNKLGALLTWKKPAITLTVGPFDPSAFDPFDASRIELVIACVDKLTSLSDDQISNIPGPRGSSGIDAQEWPRFLADEISYLLRRVPAWYIGGFGHPEHSADFAYWTKMPKFDVGELTCLSVGIDPQEFSWTKLRDLTTSKDRPQFHVPLEYLVKRFEQLSRKFDLHRGSSVVSPREFIDWAEHFEFEVHPGFIEPLKRFHPPRKSAEAAAAPGKPDKREVDSVAQLFTAMAIEQFGYNPRQARSPTTREIRDLAASLGMSITDDTILKYLRLGAEFISPDWTPHNR